MNVDDTSHTGNSAGGTSSVLSYPEDEISDHLRRSQRHGVLRSSSETTASSDDDDENDEQHHWFPQHSQEEYDEGDDNDSNYHDEHHINQHLNRSNMPMVSQQSTTSYNNNNNNNNMPQQFNVEQDEYHTIPLHGKTLKNTANSSNLLLRQSSELTHIASNRTRSSISNTSHQQHRLQIQPKFSYDDISATLSGSDIDGNCNNQYSDDSDSRMQPPPPRQDHLKQQLGQLRGNDLSDTTTTSNNPTMDNRNHSLQPNLHYFRVTFQGVVAILSLSQQKEYTNFRTGQYVSYGEIICGELVETQQHQSIVIIHSILTGGYAVDTTDMDATANDAKASGCGFDVHNESFISTTSPDYKRARSGVELSQPEEERDLSHPALPNGSTIGYIYMQQNGVEIVEPLLSNFTQNEQPPQQFLPQIDRGVFHYRILSTTPIPVLTGPNVLAPKTNSMLLPGTVHEISVRVHFPILTNGDIDTSATKPVPVPVPGVTYLRLRYRRGWIADRKVPLSTLSQSSSNYVPVMLVKDITASFEGTESHNENSNVGDSGSVSTVGSLTSGNISSSLHTAASSAMLSIATTISHHRHRLPRRRQDAATTSTSLSRGAVSRNAGEKPLMFPRHIMDTKILKKNGGIATCEPSSNISILSDDSSAHTDTNPSHLRGFKNRDYQQQSLSAPTSPNTSCSTTTNGSNHLVPSSRRHHTNTGKNGNQNQSTTTVQTYYLNRVLAPRGMRILDAPQYQVNRLIRHSTQHVADPSSTSQYNAQIEPITRTHNSIFHTMTSRLATTTSKSIVNLSHDGINYYSTDRSSSKSRILPYGSLFEASRRMETTGSYYNQGAGLIKLSDNSGWAIVPRQSELDQQYPSYKIVNKRDGGKMHPTDDNETKSFEEVGSAVIETLTDNNGKTLLTSTERKSIWVQIISRAGVQVSCYPSPKLPTPNTADTADDTASTSATSSRESSAISNPTNSKLHPSSDSDVTSSVGSGFLDALFRTPQKNKKELAIHQSAASAAPNRQKEKMTMKNHPNVTNVYIPCGTFVEIERFNEELPNSGRMVYARLHGGQGWIPLVVDDKPTTSTITCRPLFRFGSIWFRVQSTRGIKVRFGPSNRASSIKSEDGEYFRFECGEFLRASETITVFKDNGDAKESFAKLYRNRHVQLQSDNDFRTLDSLSIQAEWVQIHSETELFLEECVTEPRMERHKQGWRYNVVPENGVALRKGPSFASEKTGVLLFGGESIVVNERVTPAGEVMSWLRLKDGQGWINDFDENGAQIVIAHSLRHRVISSRNSRNNMENEKVAYNAIISRLFHSEDIRRPSEPSER